MSNAEQEWIDEIVEAALTASESSGEGMVLLHEKRLRAIIEDKCADINFTLE